MEQAEEKSAQPWAHHVRAAYILERGAWRATCRDCGWHTTDPSRRRAAAMFRLHHKEATDVIDLRGASARPTSLVSKNRLRLPAIEGSDIGVEITPPAERP